MSEVQTEATQAVTEVKGEIAKLEGDVASGAQTLLTTVESDAKSFYEKHVPAIAAIGGAAVGALVMLIVTKLIP